MIRVNFVIFELMWYKGILVFLRSVKEKTNKQQTYLFETAFCVLYKSLFKIYPI